MFSKVFKTSSSVFRLQFNQQRCFSGWGNTDKISWTQELNKSSNEATNPFYNPLAAGLKKELTGMQEQIREWQKGFKEKHGRKPTFEEMRNDPHIGPLFKSIEQQKNAMKVAVQKWRIN